MAIRTFLICLYLDVNLVAVSEENYNKLYERQGFYQHLSFQFESLQSTRATIVQIWRLALKRILKFLARFHEEEFLTGMRTDL